MTFYFSPSLKNEGNPLVSLLGGGTGSLLLANIVLLVLCIFGLLGFWFGDSLRQESDPKNLWSFVHVWLKRVILQRQAFATYLPGGRHANEGLQAFRLFGLALSWACILGSAVAVYAWFAVWHPSNFRTMYSVFSLGRFSCFPALIAGVGWLFGTWLFLLSEYDHHRRGLSQPKAERSIAA